MSGTDDSPEVFEFPAPVLRNDENAMAYHFMPLPPDVAESLLESGTRRVIVEIGDHTIERAIHGLKNGDYFLMLSKALMKTLGVVVGDVVIAAIHSDPDPDHVTVPPEFTEALTHHPEATNRWNSFTPGRKRSFMIYITQAKRPETREKRAWELAHKMETYTLHGDTPPTE